MTAWCPLSLGDSGPQSIAETVCFNFCLIRLTLPPLAYSPHCRELSPVLIAPSMLLGLHITLPHGENSLGYPIHLVCGPVALCLVFCEPGSLGQEGGSNSSTPNLLHIPTTQKKFWLVFRNANRNEAWSLDPKPQAFDLFSIHKKENMVSF